MLTTTNRATSSSSISNHDHDQDSHDHNHDHFRDIHALTPPRRPPSQQRRWETGSNRSNSMSNLSTSTSTDGENFTTISREFNNLVLAGSAINPTGNVTDHHNETSNNLNVIGEDDYYRNSLEETNPLAIVPDTNTSGNDNLNLRPEGELTVQRVKKEEVETKISAWQNAEIARINNKFKREDAIINGWESERIEKATVSMKKVERKLEEKRARALEKMQNKVAKAHRKAEERKATAEAKRGVKVAKVLEIANLMKAVGRPPAKRSFF